MKITLFPNSMIRINNKNNSNTVTLDCSLLNSVSMGSFTLFQSAIDRNSLYSEEKWNYSLTLTLEQLPTNILSIKVHGPLIETMHTMTDGQFDLIVETELNRYADDLRTPREGVKALIHKDDNVYATYLAPIRTAVGWVNMLGMTGFIGFQLVSDSDWFFDFGSPSAFLQKLYSHQPFSDFCLVAENGAELPCHKAMLAAHSDVLEAMIRSQMKESSNSKMELKRSGRGTEGIPISEDGVRAFLEFLYCNKCPGAVKSSLVALELLALGHQYAIPSMESVVKTIIMMKSAERIDIDAALQLFSHFHAQEGCEELKNKVIKVLQLKSKHLQTSELYKELYPTETSRQLFEFTLQKTL